MKRQKGANLPRFRKSLRRPQRRPLDNNAVDDTFMGLRGFLATLAIGFLCDVPVFDTPTLEVFEGANGSADALLTSVVYASMVKMRVQDRPSNC